MIDVPLGGYISARLNCYDATGASAAADSTPTYRIVPANSDVAAASGNCAARATGAYEVYAQIDAAHYTAGTVYHVLVTATVGGVTDTDVLTASFRAVAASSTVQPTAEQVAALLLSTPANKLATDANGNIVAASVIGDVGGKVLGGGDGTIAGVGAWALDGEGNAIAPADTALGADDIIALETAIGERFDDLDAAVAALPSNVGGAVVTVAGGAAESQVTLSQRRGDDAVFSFTCLDSAGAPINLADATVMFTVKPQSAREDADDAAAVIQVAATVTDADGGKCEVAVPGAATENAELYVEYDFDLQADAGAGQVRTLLVGTYCVLLDVTRESSNTSA